MANPNITDKISGTNGASASASDIEAQLEQLRLDLAELTRTVASFGSGKVQEATNRAARIGNEVAEASAEVIQSARSSLVSAEEDLEAHIRNKPLQSICIAAGVGFLAALMTRR
ncbi:DUF883 family protein [Rhizobium sp. CG5]|uniref:DUF883 family protein n=1 Tax=Rhizobium sp. CG5 TaxID=2726076 RepID=UPI002033377E|nr:DUF883 domain-containing protein [Rhizobium sp. CG5]MCM2475999.1 DUF883 family protein [Rhizobium sp. CG5]